MTQCNVEKIEFTVPHKNRFPVLACSATKSETRFANIFSWKRWGNDGGVFRISFAKTKRGENGKARGNGSSNNKFHRGIYQKGSRNLCERPARAIRNFLYCKARPRRPLRDFRSDFRTKLILWFSIRHPTYVLHIAYVSYVHFSYVPIYGAGVREINFAR